MRHTVKLEDFKGFETKHEFAGSYGQGSCKSLNAVVRPVENLVKFQVEQDHKIIYRGKSFKNAVRLYNNLS
jgi:hypothetical protein